MPISFAPISNKKLWTGYDWTIDDDDVLAELIARIALGQHRHVQNILEETGCAGFAPAPSTFEGAKKLLTASDKAMPWHRDGWLFQAISWIAAHLQSEGALIAPPHMIHAHKGFDGLHVHLDQTTSRVLSVVICEDKATGNPRRTIRDEVWNDFTSLERGERDNELTSEVSALLSNRPDLDPEQAVRQIMWKKARAFRVAITVGDDLHDEIGRKKLFKGYKGVVGGKVSRRQAETLHVDELRKWMRQIAEKAIKAAEKMEKRHV